MVSLETDKITVDGKSVTQKEKKYSFMLNKPEGYICSNTRYSKRTRLVIDFFEQYNTRLFTVGRLDKETEGLILVTNDGHFANQVIHPSSNLAKEYIAKTGHEITDKHLKEIASGTWVEGTYVKPVKVSKVRKSTVKVVVKEGKKHEVRLLLEKAGLETRYLKRVRIGGLTLGSLPVGKWKEMSLKEREAIFG